MPNKAKWEARRQKPNPAKLDISRRRADWRTAVGNFKQELEHGAGDKLRTEERFFDGKDIKSKKIVVDERTQLARKWPGEASDAGKFAEFVGKKSSNFEIVKIKSEDMISIKRRLSNYSDMAAFQLHLKRPSLAALKQYFFPVPDTRIPPKELEYIKGFLKNLVAPQQKQLSRSIQVIQRELEGFFEQFSRENVEIHERYQRFSLSNVLALGLNPKTGKLKIAIIDL